MQATFRKWTPRPMAEHLSETDLTEVFQICNVNLESLATEVLLGETKPKSKILTREGRTMNCVSLVIDSMDDAREDVRTHLEHTLHKLVSFPEDVKVNFTIGERTTIYKVSCTERVCGQIIGNRGRTIDSVRQMVLAMTARQGFRSIVEIPWFPKTK